jgi:hypothetical protein
MAAAEIDATVALPLDARPCQTQQQSLARVPARPVSPPVGGPQLPEVGNCGAKPATNSQPADENGLTTNAA